MDAPPARPPILVRAWRWLPVDVDRRVRFLAWLSLVWQVLLVVTGGLVRLTASGLGCPTWPRCTPGSLSNTPAMGIHGFIEFGNRTLTVALTVIVIAMFLAVIRMRKRRPDLFWLAFWVGMSVPAQAVVGGITVLVKLNPWIVGVHFVISMLLVSVTAILLVRVYTTPGPRELAVPRWFAFTAWAMAVFVGITVFVGILTTGAGPHPGEAGTPRNGLDLDWMEKLHSLPAYVTTGLVLLLVGASIGLTVGVVRKYLLGLVLVIVAQVGVGLLQVNIGEPVTLVDIHMLLASTLVALATVVVMNLTRPVGGTPAAAPDQAVAASR